MTLVWNWWIILQCQICLIFQIFSFNLQVMSQKDFEWITEGLLIFVFGIIGLLGNGVSIWTFWRQRVHRIFHNLLLSLAIFDMVIFYLPSFTSFLLELTTLDQHLPEWYDFKNWHLEKIWKKNTNNVIKTSLAEFPK